MVIKLSSITILLLIALTTIFSTCKKGGVLNCNENFAYTINAKVFPDKDTVNIGDTIFVEVNFPTTLTDSTSGEIAHLSGGSGIGTDIGFLKLENALPIVLNDAVTNFDFALINGRELTSSSPQSIKLYLFQEINGQFSFKLAIVPNETGTFTFNLGIAADAEEKNSRCTTFSLNYILKNTTDQHYYLYPGGSGNLPQGADYYFYVK